MRGDLSDTGLDAIFGELSRAVATGALHLEGDTGPAKVFFRDGDVYYASSPAPRAQLGARLVGAGFIDDDELDRALAAQESGPTRTKLGAILVDQGMVRRDVIRVFVQEQILDAVFDLARWDQGGFEFFRGDAVAEDLPVQIPIRALLMEVRRRLSEWADIAAVIPSLDAVPDFVPSGSATQAALEPDEFTLLTSVDGRRSIRELAHDLGYSQFDAARLIYGLSLLGVIGVPNGQRAADGSGRPETDDSRRPETDDSRRPEPEMRDGGAQTPAGAVEDTVEDEGDVDVGRALEEALFGTPFDGDEEPPEDLDEVTREAARTAGEPPEDDDEQLVEQTDEQPVGSDDLEPEIWSASIDADEVAGEPEPPRRAEPAAERGPEPAAETTAEPEAGSDARDELMALVGELQSEPDEADEVEDTEPADTEPADAEPPVSEDLGTVAPPPPSPPEPEPDPQTSATSERAERGDVSELLRELSRLAGGGPEPVAPSPDGPEDTGEEDAAAGSSGGRPEGKPDPRARPDDAGDAEGDTGTKGDKDDKGDKGDDKRSTFRRIFGSR